MKKFRVMVLLAWGWATTASAQFWGLPMAGGAKSQAGDFRISAGGGWSDEANLYGGRLSFAPLKGLDLFVDPGLIDPDKGDMGLAIQTGIKFNLPLKKSPVDVALRAAWGHAAHDISGGDVKLNSFNAGVLVSREVNLFTPYAFLGLNLLDKSEKGEDLEKDTDKTDLAAAAGLVVRLAKPFSLYAEIAHINERFYGMGARWTF